MDGAGVSELVEISVVRTGCGWFTVRGECVGGGPAAFWKVPAETVSTVVASEDGS